MSPRNKPLTDNPTKILIVDDSALYRQSIQNVLRDSDIVSIVGTAKNGIEALEKIELLDPDLLTLDVQMPNMDGIQLLNEMNRRGLRPKAIMVSGLTAEGAQATTDALMEGAFDFILKPSGNDAQANRRRLQDSLIEKIATFRESDFRREYCVRDSSEKRSESESQALIPGTACRAVVIGTSTGGPRALKNLLPRLPSDLAAPLLIVQHMPPRYTSSLAKRLNDICPFEVVEGSDQVEAVAGQAIIAPGGKQMKLEYVGSRLLVRVNDDPPENGVRPSVDYLIRSAAQVLDGNALAVILTGMGRDGLDGCQYLKQAGGYVFAQRQDDCTVYGMPKAVIDAALADRCLTLGNLETAIPLHLRRDVA